MNLCTYLRLFQPIPALLMTAVFANGAGGLGKLLFGFSHADGYLLSLLVALPLLFGIDLAAAAHTALHRPFSPLLPAVLGCVQRATLWAALVCDLAITLLVAWFFPAVPAAAVFGLAAPLLVLPCFNRRRLVARSKLVHVWINLGGLQFPFLGLVGWLVFMKLAAHRLVPAMQAAPWLFFAGGLAAGAWLLHRAFTRASLRERAETPFISPSATWIAFFNRKVMTRQQEEVRQHIARCGVGDAQQQLASCPGRDWTMRTVGPRTRDWLRVQWHATYAASQRGSFLRAQQLVFLIIFGYVLFLSTLGFLFTPIERQPFGVAGYLHALASLGTADISDTGGPIDGAIVLMASILHVGFAIGLTLASRLRPHLPYPISRERLGRVSYAHALLQIAFALAVPTGALLSASLLGQTLAGTFSPTPSILSALKLDLVFAPLLLFVATAGRFQSMIARLPSLILLAAAAITLALSRSWWGNFVFSWPGLCVIALATTGAGMLLRWQICRHYRACDLIAEAAEAKPVIFAATFHRTSAPAVA